MKEPTWGVIVKRPMVMVGIAFLNGACWVLRVACCAFVQCTAR